MQRFTQWLAGSGKHIVMAIIVGLAAANAVWPLVSQSQMNTFLTIMAALGLYSSGQQTIEKKGASCNGYPQQH